MEAPRCPICSSMKVMEGRAVDGGFLLPMDAPHGPHGMLAGSRGHGCLDCGHFWSRFDPEQFRAYVAEHSSELTRQNLDEVERGPNRDLPDTDVGRAIGAGIAELDRLARGHSAPLTRRYHDLLGVTWDEAIRESARWYRLTRAEKLEAFGWVAKKKTVPDDLD